MKKPTLEPTDSIAPFWKDLPRVLPFLLQEVAGPLFPYHQDVAMALDVLRLEEFVSPSAGGGAPGYSRGVLIRALAVKALLGIPTTAMLRERLQADYRLALLVGLSKIPSESTFSRAFNQFASERILDQVHEALVRRDFGEKLIMHVCRDSSAVPAREKPLKKQKVQIKSKGHPTRGPHTDPKRLMRQQEQAWPVALAQLPTACDRGCKRDSKGYPSYWAGYKLHLDVSDAGIPLAAYTTSASLHDSQVAIPLMKMSASRTGAVFYELMDAGYRSKVLRKAVQDLDHVPLIAPGKKEIPFDPAQAQRFKTRTAVERAFSQLKDSLGLGHVFVRGHPKVHCHGMICVLALYAKTILRL